MSILICAVICFSWKLYTTGKLNIYMNLLYHSMALASGRLEKPDTRIWNRNRKPNRNRKRNLYKNRDKIYLN